MRVVILSTYDTKGGAGIAAMRLLQSLVSIGIEASMLVQEKKSDWQTIDSVSDNFVGLWKSRFRFVYERLYFLPYERDKSIRFQFSPAGIGKDLTAHPVLKEADVIHLHWINQGFLSIHSIAQLSALKKPIVWTLHDMWAFTGGCHYSGTCEHFKHQCGNCFFLKKPHTKDLSRRIWGRKQKMFQSTDIQFVTCSSWLKGIAESSSLLGNSKIEALPNSIDTDLFRPVSKQSAKHHLGINPDRKYILFGAANINDERKGFRYFKEAIEILKQHSKLSANVELLMFGKASEALKQQLPFPVNDLGLIRDPNEIVMVYNAAETFVIPSLEDNLPNTVMEAMACGTPCVAFTTGGIPEMIDQKINGYLARYKSSQDIANGLEFIFSGGTRYKQLSSEARDKIVNHYGQQVIANKHLMLYKRLLAS